MKNFGLWLTMVIIFSLPAPVFGQGTGGSDTIVGVALGQTLRLNVVAAFPPTPCIAQLGFVNVNGAQAPQLNKAVSLNPGQADHLDFDANTVLSLFGRRVEYSLSVTPAQDVGPNACQATAEVIDNLTGFSLVALTVPVGNVPPPAPIFGVVGIALGQVLRLNVEAFPPTPCNAQLGFANASGAPLQLPGKTVNLNPGQAALLDVSAAELGIGFGQRVELRPIVSLISNLNAAPSVCQANVEVFDSVLGRTSAWLPSGPAQ